MSLMKRCRLFVFLYIFYGEFFFSSTSVASLSLGIPDNFCFCIGRIYAIFFFFFGGGGGGVDIL